MCVNVGDSASDRDALEDATGVFGFGEFGHAARYRGCMEDWNNIRVLLAVVRHGSMTKAADVLGVSTATVSRRLSSAEEALDQVLVERAPSGLVLTEAAKAMLPWLTEADAALGRAVQASKAMGDGASGVVKVAALPSLAADVICPALPRFYDEHPEIRIELMLDHRVVNLGRGDADIAIRSMRPNQENLVCRRVATYTTRPWVASSLLQRVGPDLETLPWVTWPPMNILEVRWFDEHVPNARVALVVDDMHALARACEAGVGAALMADPMATRYHGLVPVPDGPDGYESVLWMASPEAVRPLPRVEAVWRFAESLIGDDGLNPAAG